MSCQSDLGGAVPARRRLWEAGLELERVGKAVVERTRDRTRFGPDEMAASRGALCRARAVIDAALGDREFGED